jgi:hypothetical protein
MKATCMLWAVTGKIKKVGQLIRSHFDFLDSQTH